METIATWINSNWPWLGSLMIGVSFFALVHLLLDLFRDFRQDMRNL